MKYVSGIVISCLVIIVLIVGGILVNKYIDYNKEKEIIRIAKVIEPVLQAQYSYEEIQALSIDEAIKSELLDYYLAIFYSDSDSYTLIDDAVFFDSVKDEIFREQQEELDRGYNQHDYAPISNIDEDDSEYSIEVSSETSRKEALKSLLDVQYKNIINPFVFSEDNKYKIKFNDMTIEYNSGQTLISVQHQGIYIQENVLYLDKLVRTVCKNDDVYNSIHFTESINREGKQYLIFTRVNNVNVAVEINMQLSKVSSIKIIR